MERLSYNLFMRILILFVFLALSLPSPAQKATGKTAVKTTKTAPAKKSTTPIKKNTAPAKKNSAPAKKNIAPAKKDIAPAPKTIPYFEGMLLYRNYEFHSPVIRKFSFGNAYNGERSVKVVMKGNKIHIIDESLHMHTIILPDANIGYIYSDVAKQGIKSSLNFLDDYLRVLDPEYPLKNGLTKTASLKQTKESVSYKGDNCKIYKGDMMQGEDTKTEVEMWYSEKYRVYPSYRYVFSGLNPGGLLRKGIYNQSGKIPMLGKVKSLVSTELVALKSYQVPASEMVPPTDVAITECTDNKQLTALYKANRAQLKKMKMTPQHKKTSEVKYDIRQQWDFADEWIANYYDSGKKDDSWERIGNALFELGKTVSDLVQSNAGSSSKSAAVRDADMSMNEDDFNEDEDILGDVEDEKMDNELSAKDKKKLQDLRKKASSLNLKLAKDEQKLSKAEKSQDLFAGTHNQSSNLKSYQDLLDKHLDDYEKYLQLKAQIKELRMGDKYTSVDRRSDQNHIKREVNKRKQKYEKRKKSRYNYVNGSYDKKEYDEKASEIKSIKNGHGSYRGWSKGEQIDRVEKLQHEMKKIRERYNKESGDILPKDDIEDWHIRSASSWN